MKKADDTFAPYFPPRGALMGNSYPIPALLCLFGFFLHLCLSEPVLMSLGFHYSGDEGAFYEKVHPGTILIFMSLGALLISHANPIRQALIIYMQHRIFTAMLVLDALLLFYSIYRSGAGGLAFMIDTHMTAAICAIVLSYAPYEYCRKSVHLFLGIVTLNSLIGIVEAIGRFRIFTFDPEWAVLHEEYFRSSALIGHPLNNAMVTSIALFTLCAIRMPTPLRLTIITIMLVSLVAFGGRVGLAYSVVGITFLGAVQLYRIAMRRNLSMRQTFLVTGGALLGPICMIAGFYLLINSGIGERIATSGKWDDSADARRLALLIFRYLSDDEILFGVSSERIVDIAYRMNLIIPLSDIENPWLLMIMFLGAIGFSLWLVMTFAFIYRLMKNNPLALKLTVLAYFLTASTSNSFGRKDSTFLIMVSAVICASRSLQLPEIARSAYRRKLLGQPLIQRL